MTAPCSRSAWPGCTGRPQQRAGGEAPLRADAVGEQRGAPGVVRQYGREREAERLRDLPA